MSLKSDVIAVTIGGVVLLAAGWYAKKKAGELAEATVTTLYDAAQYVNPVSDKNVAYQGASAFTRWLTGNQTGDLGTIVWDYVHKAEPTGAGGVNNYTAEQQAADLRATQQLEAGFHGM
jgi:hypothetical protein